MKVPLLLAEEISFSYEDRKILSQVSLCVNQGELLVLVGPNGVGKTTLLRILSGSLAPQTGQVLFVENEQKICLSSFSPQKIAQRIAVLEQQGSPSFDFTVREMVSLGRYPHQRRFFQGEKATRDVEMIESALSQTGLLLHADRPFYSLSSGEKQRTLIALALAQEPKVLLLDEPLTHLDVKYQREIFLLLRTLTAQGLAVLCTVHDLNWASMADRVALLSGESQLHQGPPFDILTEPLLLQAFQSPMDVREEKTPNRSLWIRPSTKERE